MDFRPHIQYSSIEWRIFWLADQYSPNRSSQKMSIQMVASFSKYGSQIIKEFKKIKRRNVKGGTGLNVG